MHCLRQSIFSASLFVYSSLVAQEQMPVIDFTPSFKSGDRLIYQLVETQFRQNANGHYLYLMYDTSYMVFNVKERNDSQTLVDYNYTHDLKFKSDGKVLYEQTANPDYLHTETYNLVLNGKGEFLELSNWELFSTILIENIKVLYKKNQLDSNTLKYYYLYYQNQENVEKTVIPKVLELFDLFGKSYQLENSYSLAREMVNPFRGQNLLKSCIFKPYKDMQYPNSVFFGGQVKTTGEDNECLQDDYYAFLDKSKPDANSDLQAPYIYMYDTYNYQWGMLSRRVISYTTTHTVYIGDLTKEGLDRVYRLYAF